MDKADRWAARAANRSLCSDIKGVADFARRYIYGDLVPKAYEVHKAYASTSIMYATMIFPHPGRTAAWINGRYIIVFALAECTRADSLVAFRLSGDNTAEVVKYKRGKCPWIRYYDDGIREAR